MPRAKRWDEVGHGAAGWVFFCPACDEHHSTVEGRWTFNGDTDKPTFKPSVLLKSGHYCEGRKPGECWCTFEARFGYPAPFKCTICHSYVTDGQIQYLGDCTHAMAGQTVDLPELE